MNHDELLTAEALAEILQIQASTITRWQRQGKIPARRLSPKVLRYSLSHVLRALESDKRDDPERRSSI